MPQLIKDFFNRFNLDPAKDVEDPDNQILENAETEPPRKRKKTTGGD